MEDMEMTLRWYGSDFDTVTLKQIRQIPGVTGVITTLYDTAPGEVWSRDDKLSLRDRSLVTVVSLMAQGLTDESFRYHLISAKENGITKEEIAEIVTHAAFYCGWPKAWAVFRMAKEVWTEEGTEQ